MLEPGVIDLNLDDLSDEELAELVEEARRRLASRQARGAIARDLTLAVDRVMKANLNVMMGAEWESGRVVWDGDTITITTLTPDEYLELEFPDPDPEPDPEPSARDWVEGMSVAVGDLVRYEGGLYRVVQAHVTQAGWRPDALPALYKRE
jgi:hypothetical protein